MRQDFPDDPVNMPLSFAPEVASQAADSGSWNSLPWEILVADDDAEVHRTTRMVLAGLTFEDRPIRIHSVYSGHEASEFLKKNPQTAVLILDVVMESDIAGLIAANCIREELGNKNTRIILRTGQPGKAPESHVISHYAINDYKEKSDLTAQKLRSALITALRNFRELVCVQKERDDLRHLLRASSPLTNLSTPPAFASAVVSQVAHLFTLGRPDRNLKIRFTATDCQANPLCACFQEILAFPEWQEALPFSSFSIRSARGRDMEIQIAAQPGLSPDERDRLVIFMGHIADVLDRLFDHQPDIHRETHFPRLLEHALMRNRKRESAGHLHRVGAFSHHLALKAGLGEAMAEELRRVSPLHDIGKLAIPQDILDKKAPLSPEERAVIRTHPDIGYELLHAENRPDLHSAAIVAREHHERWDGKGYPLGIAGENIHIFGRITAIADVFDALIHDRCYKKAWSLPQAAAFLTKMAGASFDPRLVPCFIDDLDTLARIQARWPEPGP